MSSSRRAVLIAAAPFELVSGGLVVRVGPVCSLSDSRADLSSVAGASAIEWEPARSWVAAAAVLILHASNG